MLDKINSLEEKFNHISQQMADPDIASDPDKYTQLAREYSDLEDVVKAGKRYREVIQGIEDSEQILQETDDEEMKELAKMELDELRSEFAKLEKEIQQLLVPPDPNDNKNLIMEVRAGTGGDEAAIFAADLFRMYGKYCEDNKWKVELINANGNEQGGYKEITLSITGKGAYGRLKFESGVHRVQRVPETESQGRVHTSAASIAVLPAVEDVEIDIQESDLRIDTFRASGAGGQHVNRTESAIRIVHIPTGVTVSCQDEKSQHKNKAKAMKVLKARLYDMELRSQQESMASQRRNMIRSGDRSEKIRTYNFPQGRVTDHRIGLTLYRLDEVMQGSLDMLIDELRLADQEEQLKLSATE